MPNNNTSGASGKEFASRDYTEEADGLSQGIEDTTPASLQWCSTLTRFLGIGAFFWIGWAAATRSDAPFYGDLSGLPGVLGLSGGSAWMFLAAVCLSLVWIVRLMLYSLISVPSTLSWVYLVGIGSTSILMLSALWIGVYLPFRLHLTAPASGVGAAMPVALFVSALILFDRFALIIVWRWWRSRVAVGARSATHALYSLHSHQVLAHAQNPGLQEAQ